MHSEPAAQPNVQLSSVQVKSQLEPGPQLHEPFAHSPSQVALSPAHSTWHGPASQVNVQLEPSSHEQVPLAQTAEHSVPSSHAA